MTWKNLPPEPTPPLRDQRDGYGTIGPKIMLTTNHFEVKIGNPELILYHYDVKIKDFKECDELPKKKRIKIFEAMKKTYPKVFGPQYPLGYDCVQSAFGSAVIPQLKKKNKPQTYDVNFSDRGYENSPRSKYTITLKLVNSANLKDLLNAFKPGGGIWTKEAANVIQMCEVMFRHYRAFKYEQVGLRSFFSMDNEFGKPFAVGNGKEGHIGFFASLRPAQWKSGLTLNVDTAYAAFYKEQSVIDFLKEERIMRDERQPLSARDCDRASVVLKGLRIRTTHSLLPRTYKVQEVKPVGADRLKFPFNKEGQPERQRTVLDYFENELKFKLNFRTLNCLHVGNIQKTNYLPIEVCRIDKGQKVQKQLNDMETREFIKSTAIPPKQRLERIRTIARQNNFAQDPMLKALSFTVSDSPIMTAGKVLPAPHLRDKAQINCRDGKWQTNKFYKPASLEHWAVLNYDDRTRKADVERFVNAVIDVGQKAGMTIKYPFDIFMSRNTPFEDLQHYKNENKNLQLVVCIFSRKTDYGAIKLAGDVKLKIITQCILARNAQESKPQLIKNLLLKINSKLGGTHTIVGSPNTSIGLALFEFDRPVLVMGADVNHPPAGNSTMPSLVAVVGSTDAAASRYAVEIRAQTHRTEVIEDMTEIAKNLLTRFYKETRFKPERIIMYRDGVSESQFQEVLQKEMSKIRAACTQLDKSYTPGITFICVQKRHHTRLFCDERAGIGRTKNVPPGTIVDRDITHPKENDFFLVSHEGIQGTSKPSHYHVLWDDNDLHANVLQMMTYKLCHVYSRCTRAVSIPTPAYYAHLAAFRAKTHVAAYLDQEQSTEPDVEKIGREIARMSTKDNDSLAKELYYV